MLELKARYKTRDDLKEFADFVIQVGNSIGFKVSARGWCYIAEGNGLINKHQFDRIEELINKCRGNGLLPIDFVKEELARGFEGVETPDRQSIVGYFGRYLEAAMECDEQYTPDWWEDEEYYIQIVVEKVDLIELFQPVCRKYKIPIANSKGWSSMLQRAEYARRFRDAEMDGKQCVLLYCGDHDPDGLRISDFLKSNLEDVSSIRWSDGKRGYYPSDLIIDRFGLHYDFITDNDLLWIDNLYTGRGKDLADPKHPNHNMPYLQDYLTNYGARKVEANAMLVIPQIAMELCEDAILKYLGEDAEDRFEAKREKVREDFKEFLVKTKLRTPMERALKIIKQETDNE